MNETLTNVCQDLRNWFEREKYIGEITIGENGALSRNGTPIELAEGQYFRVIGSIFADGVHQYPDTVMLSEVFDGAVWALAIPQAVINLSAEIDSWQTKYGGADGVATSPFTSESFGGYSYTKASSTSSAGVQTWQSVFRPRLNQWRKL